MELLGLFVASFLAATLLPGGSEAVLLMLLAQSPELLYSLVFVASLGNTLGSLTSYGVGYLGRVKLAQAQFNSRSAKLIERFGVWALLLSWLPLIGDLLCVLAGYFKLRFWPSVLLISLGKTARYSILAFVYLRL